MIRSVVAVVSAFVLGRYQHAAIDRAAPLAAVAAPEERAALIEATLQASAGVAAERLHLAGDVSAFLRTDEPSLLVPNEAYADLDVGAGLSILVGRRRLAWGPGIMASPTDVLDPPRDPVDPSSQRAGAYVARLELARERWAATAAWAARVRAGEHGLPAEVDATAGIGALRGYALVLDGDLNALYFADASGDGVRHLVGATFSRLVGEAWELHADALGYRGDRRPPPAPADLLSCPEGLSLPPAAEPGRGVRIELVAGGRRAFSDETLLSVEYLHHGEGLSDDRFADLRDQALPLLPLLVAAGCAARDGALSDGGERPAKLGALFLRRNYLLLAVARPHLARSGGWLEDVSATLVAVGGLDDGAVALYPQLGYALAGRAALSLGALLLVGPDGSQYDLAPAPLVGIAELRVAF